MKRILAAAAALACALAAQAAQAVSPLVDVAWVKAHRDDPGVVILDIREQDVFAEGHIPGAAHSSYAKDGWRMERPKGRQGMLPSADELSVLIGGIGIDNDAHVVIVSGGASALQLGSATRVYWTFKVAGHDAVSVLNGGMTAYTAAVDKVGKPLNPLKSGPALRRSPKTFKVALRQEMVATRLDVQKAIAQGTPLVDHRPDHHYLGITKPGPVKRAGTLPGAVNVPESWMTTNAGGAFRSSQELAQLFEAAGAPTSGPVVNFCNSGHWASLGWFASHELLGNQDAKLYDGSMIEWSATDQPMERKVTLK